MSSSDSSEDEKMVEETTNQRPQDNLDLELIEETKKTQMLILTTKVKILSNIYKNNFKFNSVLVVKFGKKFHNIISFHLAVISLKIQEFQIFKLKMNQASKPRLDLKKIISSKHQPSITDFFKKN